jgi:hypothetical protein
MLVFTIDRGGQNVKVLKSARLTTILADYVDYCHKRGFRHCVYSADSYGNYAWQNKYGEVLLLKPFLYSDIEDFIDQGSS